MAWLLSILGLLGAAALYLFKKTNLLQSLLNNEKVIEQVKDLTNKENINNVQLTQEEQKQQELINKMDSTKNIVNTQQDLLDFFNKREKK